MPLDKVILDHIEDMELIEEKVDKDIDNMLSKLDIDAVLENPDEALFSFAFSVQSMLEDRYYPTVADKGLAFADDVRKDGEVKVFDSNDPNLNKEVVDVG